jgi:hypothetical protein
MLTLYIDILHEKKYVTICHLDVRQSYTKPAINLHVNLPKRFSFRIASTE